MRTIYISILFLFFQSIPSQSQPFPPSCKREGLKKIVIDKYLQAGLFLADKLKPQDNYNQVHYEQILLEIKDSISNEFLNKMNIEQKIEIKHEYIDRALFAREFRRKANNLKDKLIEEIRVYSVDIPHDAMSPYDNKYEKIFCDILKCKKLLCPGYTHLYIHVSSTDENALISTMRWFEPWYRIDAELQLSITKNTV